MPIDERSISLPEQWARDAQTVIPAPPVPGIAYRNTAITPEQWAHGQDYSRVADSAQWNQMFWTMSGLLKSAEQYGIMPYSPFTNYEVGGLCLGLDGELYQALQKSGPSYGGAQPNSNDLYWWAKNESIFETYTGTTPLTDFLNGLLRPGQWYWFGVTHYPNVTEKPYVGNDPTYSVLFKFVCNRDRSYSRCFWFGAQRSAGDIVATNTYTSDYATWAGWKRYDQGAVMPTTTVTNYAVPASGGTISALGSGWLRFIADATINGATINVSTPVGTRIMGNAGTRLIVTAPVNRGVSVSIDYNGVTPVALQIHTTVGGN